MKFTVGSLIKELEKFPEDLEIVTELSFLWNYPDSLMESEDVGSDGFEDLSKANADELLIFEGSWEKDNISDVDNILEEYLQVRT